MTDTPPESLTPDEAFALVGHETRVAILQAVVDAAREADDPFASVGFSELRERVGMRDSGGFNYHLGKLVGPFLEHDEEGYRPRYTTLLVVGAILSGVYTEQGSAEPVAVDTPCPICDGVIEATYERERAVVACTDCGETFYSSAVPPGALEGYDTSEYPDVFARWTSRLMAEMRSGFCLACLGRVDTEVRPEGGEPVVHYRCRRCPERSRTSVAAALLDHPAMVSFHWDHGIDVREVVAWDLPWLHGDTTLVSEDPLRAECTAELGGETLTLTVDGTLSVLVVERS